MAGPAYPLPQILSMGEWPQDGCGLSCIAEAGWQSANGICWRVDGLGGSLSAGFAAMRLVRPGGLSVVEGLLDGVWVDEL